MKKRSYGGFSAASARVLRPLVEPLGYRHLAGASFVRDRGDWRDGFFLQQSQWGGGEFCVNVGVDVPAVQRLLSPEWSDRSFAVTVGGRLSPAGVGLGDHWFAAAEKAELERSALEVATHLRTAESWFGRFASLTDIAAEYLRVSNIKELGSNTYWQQVFVTVYATLLAIAGDQRRSVEWLLEAKRCVTEQRDAKGRSVPLDSDDQQRLAAIERLLAQDK